MLREFFSGVQLNINRLKNKSTTAMEYLHYEYLRMHQIKRSDAAFCNNDCLGIKVGYPRGRNEVNYVRIFGVGFIHRYYLKFLECFLQHPLDKSEIINLPEIVLAHRYLHVSPPVYTNIIQSFLGVSS